MLNETQKKQLESIRKQVQHIEAQHSLTAVHKRHVLRGLDVALADPRDLVGGVAYRKAAKSQYHSEGQVEIDDDALVSESEEGAYVQAWVWVPKEMT